MCRRRRVDLGRRVADHPLAILPGGCMRGRVGSLVAVLVTCAAFAGCGPGVNTGGATGDETPTSEEPTPTPGETATPAPTPGNLSRVSVTFTDVYVENNSEPFLTDPGECLF